MAEAVVLVFLGGGLGSVVRYGIARALPATSGFPWATFTANSLSGLVLGAVLGILLASPAPGGDRWRLLLVTGFCGGFSTFSTFSNDGLAMLQSGQPGLAGLYAGASWLTCMGGIALGMWWARMLMT